MVEVAALSIADAAASVAAVAPAVSAEPEKADLVAVFQALLAATPAGPEAPLELLHAAAGVAAAAPPAVVESLPTRARVVMRLLRLKLSHPAWAVLVDSATGVVSESFRATTSSGANRTDWPLPLLTSVEPPDVYAELPGFRDPRWQAPDAAYEIGGSIKLRCHVDEVLPARRPALAGWAAIDVLDTRPEESVTLVARHEGVEVSWPGTRHRRADQVGGTRETLRRRAWAGWCAQFDPADLTSDGRWTLWLEIGQQGLTRRVRIGKSSSELAARAVGAPLTTRPRVNLVQGNGGWSLTVSTQRRR